MLTASVKYLSHLMSLHTYQCLKRKLTSLKELKSNYINEERAKGMPKMIWIEVIWKDMVYSEVNGDMAFDRAE